MKTLKITGVKNLEQMRGWVDDTTGHFAAVPDFVRDKIQVVHVFQDSFDHYIELADHVRIRAFVDPDPEVALKEAKDNATIDGVSTEDLEWWSAVDIDNQDRTY